MLEAIVDSVDTVDSVDDVVLDDDSVEIVLEVDELLVLISVVVVEVVVEGPPTEIGAPKSKGATMPSGLNARTSTVYSPGSRELRIVKRKLSDPWGAIEKLPPHVSS